MPALLRRAVGNPEVANALPRTASALERWNRRDAPPADAYAAVLADLGALPDSADAGALARRLNSEVAGARSLVMNAYKALPLGVVSLHSAAVTAHHGDCIGKEGAASHPWRLPTGQGRP
jgi:hypothetical protein